MLIEIEDGERRLLRQQVSSGRLVIGRSDVCDLSLPYDTVSRRHLELVVMADGLWARNLGSVGATLNQAPLTEALLTAGDEVRFGELTLRALEVAAAAPALSSTRLVQSARHEDLVGARGVVAAARATLEFEKGPLAGESRVLNRARNRVSGPDATLPLGDAEDACPVVLRVVRGRVMVEPGGQPVYVSGQRAREITPILPGEPVRIADHVFVVRERVVEAAAVPTTLPPQQTGAGFGALVGSSMVMRALFDTLSRVARHDATVLLHGASGTGKELAARGLHDAGPRMDAPFVAINCAALPPTLVETELFGATKGAYTGADQDRDGAFQRAAGGTLFLDEIGEMTLDVQAKVLRTLETGEVRRVGAQRPTFPDVRVVCATHQDLRKAVRERRFRQDLFFRIGVLQLRMPSLSEHLEDLPELVERLLSADHAGARCSEAAMQRLARHPWPGNVRELRNVLTRAVVLYGGQPIEPAHLSFDRFEAAASAPDQGEEAERALLLRTLEEQGGNRSKTARVLGIPRTTLLYKLKRHGLV